MRGIKPAVTNVIILKIPRKMNNKNLREFILHYVKKMRRNQNHRYIQLKGEVAYSNKHVYFIFMERGIELAFALSIYFKCKQYNIPCSLELSKPIEINNLPEEIIKAAKTWSERKLSRKYYRLRQSTLST